MDFFELLKTTLEAADIEVFEEKPVYADGDQACLYFAGIFTEAKTTRKRVDVELFIHDRDEEAGLANLVVKAVSVLKSVCVVESTSRVDKWENYLRHRIRVREC